MMSSIAWAREALCADFKDTALLTRALTHKTMGGSNYERLEFLGDRILGAVIAEQLYRRFPDETEGKLSRRLHGLVSRETCAAIARERGVAQHVRLNNQARADGGANSDNILGDVMEALIGAVYLDCGPKAVEKLIVDAWAKRFSDVEAGAKHPKSAVQEWALGHSLPGPRYELLHRSGPHHNPVFHVRLHIEGREPIDAEGGSKQEAETRAARAFLDKAARQK